MPAKEVVCIHLGQAGCHVGQHLWELLCLEHKIQPDGEILEDEYVPHGTVRSHADRDSQEFSAFFSETSSGQHVPRSVFFDTDPASKEDLLSSNYAKIYHPDNIIGYKKDSKNNYFEALSMSREYHFMETLMDRIRLSVDLCHNLQGFFVFRSFGGGTGTGVGNELLELLSEQFKKKVIFEPAIYPSTDFACSIVEPYNCMFATANSRDTANLSLMLDNQAAYKLCKNNLKLKNPTFNHLNRLISQMVSAVTTSLRFETELNASLAEILTNLVPDPIYRYPVLSLSPVRAPAVAKHERFTTKEIVVDLFEQKNMMCDIGPLQKNRFLSACVLLRGTESGSGADEAASYRSGAAGSSFIVNKPIQINDVHAAISDLMSPKQSHRERLKFLPWLESGGFKVGVMGKGPVIPKVDGHEFMAGTDRQGALLANTTAVRSLFVRQYKKFLKLFYHKAYVWQFLESNGELDLFYEAQEKVRSLIDDYERLLRDCIKREQEKNELVVLHGETRKVDAETRAVDAGQ
eukprot:GEMP01038636.1.p1 GENE.GEMP01038636.1~~GEMP01038636.1.p1  ORF type:complete len:519 (+),score=80.04 GEMP01038636.1:142-1698(+)